MNYYSFTIILLMLATLFVVIIGVSRLAFNKKQDTKTSNKLMVLRVSLQAFIILIIACLYFIKN